jgi:electron transport complex protein RnfC
VQYYRFAKTEIWNQEREREKADIARQRHEYRIFRLDREKDERAARLKQKQAALKSTKGNGDGDQDPKKAAIQAALERAKAKKASASMAPKNTDNLTEAQQQAITSADERRRNRGPAIATRPEDT